MDRQMDGGDCITFHANTVGNNPLGSPFWGKTFGVIKVKSLHCCATLVAWWKVEPF